MMKGAYEGLMGAAQGMQRQPMQSMGGQAQPVGWKDVTPVADRQIREIMGEMEALHGKYVDPNQDILPEDAARMNDLRDMLHTAHQWKQHSLEQAGKQQGFTSELDKGGQATELQRALEDIPAGKIPPPTRPGFPGQQKKVLPQGR
jgi:hypothetical protein